jgi:endonuclease-8
VPEGHTLRRAAASLQPLVGAAVAVEAPHPRHRGAALGPALDGRVLESATARGKHLLLRFSGGRILHSHLRMTGSWEVYREGAPWRRSAASAWLVMRARGLVAVQFRGPVLELLDERALRLHPSLSRLGPDVLDEGFDPREAVRRLRAGVAPEAATIGDALLDQRLACGIGNVYKSESLWASRLDPWAPVAALDDAAIAGAYAEARRRMLLAVDGRDEPRRAYGRHGCPRCGGAMAHRAQGDDGRVTWWCLRCQPSLAASR